MILRLKSRLASGLIIATGALAGASVARAADSAAAGNDAATRTGTPAATTTTTPSTPSTAQGAADMNMAPRGNDAATTTHATPGGAGAGDNRAKAIFDQLDLNHDGMLSLDEFSRATFQQPK